LAYQPVEEVNRVLRKLRVHTPHTVTNPDILRAEIDAVRVCGYATNREGWRVGVAGAAAPVFVGRNNAIAALAIVGLADRLDDDKLKSSGELLSKIAMELSIKLGYDERNQA
jgi:DNA-binding IclR family transcriptional regulator